MKKNKAKAAAKVDVLLAEAFTNDEARMQQIREQAHAELLRRTAEQPVKTKKKGLCYSVPALCALVIILIVAPVVATILNPVSYSQANQFVRKATVWVNDTFKLGIELPVEEGEEKQLAIQTNVFLSVQDAAAYLEKEILAFEENEATELLSVEVTDYADVSFVMQNYKFEGCDVRLTLETVFERTFEAPKDNAVLLNTKAGAVWMWKMENMSRAIGIIDDWSVNIYVYSINDSVEELLASLTRVN